MFEFQMDFSKRISNPAFCISLVGAIIVLLKMCGLDVLANIFPKNYADIITQFFAILSLLGIVVDPTTKGVSDKIISPNQQVSSNLQDVQKELKDNLGVSGLTATGSVGITNQNDSEVTKVQATENLNASSKITVDVPQE